MKLVLVLFAFSTQSFASGNINVQPQVIKNEMVKEKMKLFQCKANESLANCLARFKAQPLQTK